MPCRKICDLEESLNWSIGNWSVRFAFGAGLCRLVACEELNKRRMLRQVVDARVGALGGLVAMLREVGQLPAR